VKIKSKSD